MGAYRSFLRECAVCLDEFAYAGDTAPAAMEPRTARELVDWLTRDAERIARNFGLRFRSLEAERPNVRRRYGICYADGSIRIRLFHAVTGRPLRYSSLVSTLCHELAHLRHFNHGKRFRAFYLRLLEYARHQGIYRPGGAPERARPTPPAVPRAAIRPEQLRLFD